VTVRLLSLNRALLSASFGAVLTVAAFSPASVQDKAYLPPIMVESLTSVGGPHFHLLYQIPLDNLDQLWKQDVCGDRASGLRNITPTSFRCKVSSSHGHAVEVGVKVVLAEFPRLG